MTYPELFAPIIGDFLYFLGKHTTLCQVLGCRKKALISDSLVAGCSARKKPSVLRTSGQDQHTLPTSVDRQERPGNIPVDSRKLSFISLFYRTN
jgi:hypothetical protein